MNGFKWGLIFPGIPLLVFITVIGISIYQLNSDENPWDLSKKPRYNRNILGKITMKPEIVEKPAIRIAGFANKTKSKEEEYLKAIPKFWYDYCTDGRQEKLHKELFLKSHEEYGACFPENPENGEFEYVIGLEVKEGYDIPKGYHVYTIPEAMYAVFTTPPADEAYFVSSVLGTWKYIINDWLPTSGYKFASNGVNFELYDERSIKNTNKVMNIFIPIVKK